jgi:hypothetical protein
VRDGGKTEKVRLTLQMIGTRGIFPSPGERHMGKMSFFSF